MSGGAYDYFSDRIMNFVYDFVAKTHRGEHSPEAVLKRLAFAKLMEKVAEAVHDIEWVDSSDYAPGDEIPAIDKVITTPLIVEAVTSKLDTLVEAAKQVLSNCEEFNRVTFQNKKG